MSRSYLVTGGAGFLGSALVKALVARGERVRVLDDCSRGHPRRLQDVINQIELVTADIRDADKVRQAMGDIDCVCHLAFINGTEYFYSKPELVLDVGVRGMLNVLDACLACGVGELMLASSSEVYQTAQRIPTDEAVPLTIPDPLNPRYSYAAGKLISEILAINYGRTHFHRVVVFRPHNVYGPDMGFEHVIPALLTRAHRLHLQTPAGEPLQFPIQGDGFDRRSFVYVDDFIDGLLRVIDHGKHLDIFHIGTMDEIEISQLATLVARHYGRQIVIQAGASPPGGTRRRCPDIGKLAQLGYSPRVGLSDGVARTAAWYDQHSDLAPPDVLGDYLR